jgi:hypothetical protein
VLPAGRYATLLYEGALDGLVTANQELQAWAREQQLGLQARHGDRGELWVSRVEWYLSQPDPGQGDRYRVRIAYLLKDNGG